MFWDYRLEQKWSAVGFCSGAIAGLVAITPASGYVGPPASVLCGFMAGTLCNFSTQLKFMFGYDDVLDIFACHAIGGILGNLLTGLFAQASVVASDGRVIPGGWMDHHYIQLVYQLMNSAAGFAWSFVITTGILWVMHFIPGLRLRCSEEAEMMGIDIAEMGEYAYDYVALDAEQGKNIHPHGIHEVPIQMDGLRALERRGGHPDMRPHSQKGRTELGSLGNGSQPAGF